MTLSEFKSAWARAAEKTVAREKEYSALDADPRFDMPNFCPNQEYIREMKRYGILPQDADPARCRIDPYDVDRRYWSLDWTDLK